MGQLQERITSTRQGSVTSVQAIYVPADDLTDPAPASVFAHLNATTVLSRGDLREGHLPGRRPARLDLDDPQGRHRRPGALRRRQARQGDPAALQGAAGHHRDPRHRRALRGGQDHRAARAQGRALPLAAVPRRRAVHRHRRRRTCRSPRRCARSARSSRASTTSCRSRRSCSRARSTTSSRPRRSSAAGEARRTDGAHEVPGRGPDARGRGLQRRGRDALDAHRGGLDRRAGQPHAAARRCSSRPSCGCTAARRTSSASRRARATSRSATTRRSCSSRRRCAPRTSNVADLQEQAAARGGRGRRRRARHRGRASRAARQAPLGDVPAHRRRRRRLTTAPEVDARRSRRTARRCADA